jgi:two-component system chemotaxis response regulator CheY
MTDGLPPILLIEDDEDIRVTTVEFLEMEGFDAVGCPNGKIALAHLELRRHDLPKLILVDLMMPVMDGAGFLEAKNRDPELAEIPCAVMSADSSLPEKCRALGVAHLVRKPVDLDALLSLIQSFVTPSADRS